METFEPAEPLVQTAAGGLSLHVTSDIQRIKPLWMELQAATPCTVAQTFDWGRAWSEHMLAPAGGAPVVAIGYGANGAAKFLLPFETKRLAGMTVLKWLGQDHANYSFGLFAADVARLLTKKDVSCVLRAIARHTGAAAAYFEAQPFSWEDVPNPFALLPHQPAPNSGFAVELGDFQADSRSARARPFSGKNAASRNWDRCSMAGPRRTSRSVRCSIRSSNKRRSNSLPWA